MMLSLMALSRPSGQGRNPFLNYLDAFLMSGNDGDSIGMAFSDKTGLEISFPKPGKSQIDFSSMPGPPVNAIACRGPEQMLIKLQSSVCMVAVCVSGTADFDSTTKGHPDIRISEFIATLLIGSNISEKMPRIISLPKNSLSILAMTPDGIYVGTGRESPGFFLWETSEITILRSAGTSGILLPASPRFISAGTVLSIIDGRARIPQHSP